jgi:hypothetical protein
MTELNKSTLSKLDTLDFIFDFVKDAPERQLHDAEMLDNKIIQILSVASIIIGLVGFGVGKISLNHTAEIAPLIVAILAYIVVVCLSIIHLKAISFRRSLHADELWQEHWDENVVDIKHDLVADIGEAYGHNKGIIDKKKVTLLWTLVFIGIQVVSIGVFVTLLILT